MSIKASIETAVNPTFEPVGELPDFAFIGTDGEYYHLSKTPAEFIRLLKETGVNPIGFDFETFDRWIWLHLKSVPAQRHIPLEQVHKLYFQCDVPSIVDMIFRRLDECKNSSAQTVQVIANRFNQMQEAQSAPKQDGNLRQGREKSGKQAAPKSQSKN